MFTNLSIVKNGTLRGTIQGALFCMMLLSKLQAAGAPMPRFIPFRDGDKWGYCDSTGVVRIPPQWDWVDFFAGTKAVVKLNANTGFTKDDAYALIDTTGRYIIPPDWHWDRSWSGWKTTMLNMHDSGGRYGLADTNGRLLIPFGYDMPSYYRPTQFEGYRIVGRGGKTGLVDTGSGVLFPFHYESIEDISIASDPVPLFRVKQRGLYGVVDRYGGAVVPVSYAGVDRSVDTLGSPQRRSGFLLHNLVLQVPGDSSRGIANRYGWIDYPGSFRLEPSYEWFQWVAPHFYRADKSLYDERRRRALPASYQDIIAFRDTVLARRVVRKRKDSVLWAQYKFKGADMQELSRREEWVPVSSGRSGRVSPMWCGTAAYQSSQEEAREASRPYIRKDGVLVTGFEQDGYRWKTRYRVATGVIALQGFRPEGNSHAEAWAIVDTAARMVTGVIGISDYRRRIVGYNPDSKLIIWEQNGQYALSDQRGYMQIPFQSRVISNAWYYHTEGPLSKTAKADAPKAPGSSRKSRQGIWVVAPPPEPVIYVVRDILYAVFSDPVERRSRFDPEELEGAVSVGTDPKLCFSSGKPVPALGRYNFMSAIRSDYTDANGGGSKFRVADSAGKQAFVDLDGKFLLPRIAFQYQSIETANSELFVVGLVDGKKKLIDSNNRPLLEGRNVQRAHYQKERSRSYPEPLFTNNEAEKSELMYADYEFLPGQYRRVYMNRKGKPFAGKL
jgi:hypothetical protein